MTKQNYLKLKKTIEKVLQTLEEEAIQTGKIISSDYHLVVDKLKKKVIENSGFNFEEYIEYEKEIEQKEETNNDLLEETLTGVSEKLKGIPTDEKIISIAREIAQEYVEANLKPPQIINKIVKEITKEQPINTTKIIREIIKEEDNSKVEELKKDIILLQETFHELREQIPNETDILKQLRDEIDDFKKVIEQEKKGIGSGFRADEIWKQIRATKTVELRRSDYSLNLSVGSLSDIDITGIVAGQILKWDGSKFEPAADNSSLWQRTGTTLSPLTAGDSVTGSGLTGVVKHGATASTARPTGYTNITWIGSIEPTNAENDDVWIDTA